jgi:integrase
MIFKIQTGQIDINPQEVKTVEYYCKVFLEYKKLTLKDGTYKKYEEIVRNKILPFFGDRAVDSIKVIEVKKWFNYWLGYKSTSLALYIANTFKAVLQEALYDEAIIRNPFDVIKRPRRKSNPAQPFSIDEIKLLLENAEGWFKNFLGVSFFTGMRTGEVVGLKWDDISFTDRTIEVKRTRKYGKDQEPKTPTSKRIIPIFDEVMPYLENQFEITGNENSYLFLTMYNGPFNDGNRIRDYHWKKLLKKVGFEYRRLYDTRSSYATMMLSSGNFSVNEIAQTMGHSTIDTLIQKYNKFIPAEMNKISKSIGVI